MPHPLTSSTTPLVFDALSALKVRYYSELPPAGKIYTYARFYLLNGGLSLSLVCFERTPAAESRVAFALCGPDGDLVCTFLSPTSAQAALLPRTQATHLTPSAAEAAASDPVSISPNFFAGEDEQGWYWGANISLPASILLAAGVHAEAKSPLWAAVFQYKQDAEGFGASHCFSSSSEPMDATLFQPYIVTNY